MESSEWPDEPAERITAVVERVLDQLDLEGSVAIEEDEQSITATVQGEDDYGLLIGRRGQTIDALQLICFQAAFQGMRDRKRVVLDAAGYRDRRAEVITERAERAAERAIASGDEVELDPMPARERRVVHEYLKERTEVETYSAGDEPQRRVVVAPLLAD
jgi:spoIIIJ-associated protein